MLWQGLEPTSVELHPRGTFWRTLYWLSYRAVAETLVKVTPTFLCERLRVLGLLRIGQDDKNIKSAKGYMSSVHEYFSWSLGNRIKNWIEFQCQVDVNFFPKILLGGCIAHS